MRVEEHPNGVRTRPATTADRARCFELIETLTEIAATDRWADVYASHLAGERGAIVVAENDDAILGVATVSYNVSIRYGGEYCQVEEVVVDPAARGRKVSTALMEAALDHARGRGCEEIGAYVVDNASENRSFYEKFNFVQVGVEMRQRLDN